MVRGGVRAGRPTLVVHARRSGESVSRAGFVVSKAIGNAVTRNRVKRQLRHLVAGRLGSAPAQVSVVVRALPPAASGRVAQDFSMAWKTALEKLGGTA